MKKFMAIFIITFILIINNVFLAFAKNISKENTTTFTITSGLDFYKENNATFDKTRTITGKANEKSIVTIKVYEKTTEKEKELKEIESYKIVVGASKFFSQTINLSLGENIVDIIYSDKNEKDFNVSTSIIRKKSEIKNELEQAIILPRTRR